MQRLIRLGRVAFRATPRFHCGNGVDVVTRQTSFLGLVGVRSALVGGGFAFVAFLAERQDGRLRFKIRRETLLSAGLHMIQPGTVASFATRRVVRAVFESRPIGRRLSVVTLEASGRPDISYSRRTAAQEKARDNHKAQQPQYTRKSRKYPDGHTIGKQGKLLLSDGDIPSRIPVSTPGGMRSTTLNIPLMTSIRQVDESRGSRQPRRQHLSH